MEENTRSMQNQDSFISSMTAGLSPIVENKKHPRERSNEIEFRGRIRVQLKNEDGTPFKEEFKSRELYLFDQGCWKRMCIG